MTLTQISYLFETALIAMLEANAEVMRIYGQKQLDVNYKPDKSPVTQADKASSDIICKYLEKTGIPVICEEISQENYAVRKTWEYFWLVDPLDGTKEFIKRNGEFTVNIALVHTDTPIMGLISIPAKGLLYWGDYQNGAFKIEIRKIKKINYNVLINKASKLPLTDRSGTLKIMVSRSHLDEQTIQYIQNLTLENKKVKTIAAGSSLKFCYIAEGKADLYLRFSPTMEWDTAAGHAIVVASGARMMCLPSKSTLYYNKESLKNEGFIVFRND